VTCRNDVDQRDSKICTALVQLAKGIKVSSVAVPLPPAPTQRGEVAKYWASFYLTCHGFCDANDERRNWSLETVIQKAIDEANHLEGSVP
jgi:hypothetical protein